MGKRMLNEELQRPEPRLRRAYYECRFGQLHLHNAIPGGGGFDELTPVLCVHGAEETGRVFVPLMPILGRDRSVYAPDLPGCGGTDPAPGVAPLDAGVSALEDFLDSMRIRNFDVLARGTGQAIARQLAQRRGAALRRNIDLDGREPSAELAVQLLAALSGASRPA